MRVYAMAVLLLAGPTLAFSDDLEGSYKKLREATASRNVSLVRKLAPEVCAMARQEAAAPAPESETQKEYWTKRQGYLRDIEVFTEYALYAVAIQSPPAEKIALLAALEQQNCASKYMDDGYSQYVLGLTQTGERAKVPTVAERGLKSFPENEDLLLIMADNALSRKQTDRASTYAERAISVMAKHPKPETLSAAAWERKKSLTLGRSRWIAGVAHAEKGQHFEADKDLRAALPLIAGDEAMTATALFHLGVANYQLAATMRDKARMLEAAKFSDKAAAIKGPVAEQAWRNAQAMRAEAQKLR